jgi:outer membrane protein OmpA-like peptidoglycan-associated protein
MQYGPPAAMSRYDTYQSNAAEAPIMRRWIIRALVLSILIHGGLFVFFYSKKLENFGIAEMERLAPPIRVFKRVAIPKMPEDAAETRLQLPEKTPNVARLQLPKEKPEVSEVRVAPQNPDLPKTLVPDKPSASISDTLAKVEAASRGSMEKELNSIAGALIKEGPSSPRQPTLILPKTNKPGDGGLGDGEGIPGMQSIDAALQRTGPLPVGDKIGMPGGALFEHDHAELLSEAIDTLQKLAELVQRNPKATFSIEGHTDATGTPEYNQRLSERRAEAVKVWLVEKFAIAPERIQTVGMGSSKLIVPADKSIDEQRPNRRVEIVIKTNRK